MSELTVGVKLKADSSGLVGEVRVAKSELDKLAGGLGSAAKEADNLSAASNRQVGALSAATAGFKALGLTIGALGLASLAGSVVRSVFEFEKLQGQLRTVTGSSIAAKQAFAWIEDFAATTPFSLQEVTGAFVKLQAMGLDPSRAALQSYGNTASAMGKSMDQMIEAVADAATGEFERLKEFGIRASQENDKVTFSFRGVSTTVGKDAGEIEGYLRRIGDVQFGSAMADQSNSLVGATSNMKDAFASVARAIGDAGLTDLLNGVARALADAASAVKSTINQFSDNGSSGNALVDERINLGAKRLALAEAENALREKKSGNLVFGEMFTSTASLESRVAALRNEVTGSADRFNQLVKGGVINTQQPLTSSAPAPASGKDKKGADKKDRTAEMYGAEQAETLRMAYPDATQTAREFGQEQAKVAQQLLASMETAEQFGQRMADLARLAYPDAAQSAEEYGQAQARVAEQMLASMDTAEEYGRRQAELAKLAYPGATESGESYGERMAAESRKFLEQNKTFAKEYSDVWGNAAAGFTANIGRSVADAILEQKNFSDLLRVSVRSMAREVIAALVSVAARRAAMWVAEKVGLISTAAVAAPAAAAVTLASLGKNIPIALAGLAATFALSRSLAGQAHDGLDYVPRTGTFLLEGGERVVKKEDNKRLSQFLDGQGGGSGSLSVTFNINTLDARGVGQLLEGRRNQIVGMIQSAYDERGRRGGPVS